VTPQVEK